MKVTLDGEEVDVNDPGCIIDLAIKRTQQKIEGMNRQQLIDKMKEKVPEELLNDPEFHAWVDSLSDAFIRSYYLEVLQKIGKKLKQVNCAIEETN